LGDAWEREMEIIGIKSFVRLAVFLADVDADADLF
jgi:hypothetical protein